MNWQFLLVSVLVVAAAAYLLRAAWRTWAVRSGCGGGCGCAKKGGAERGTFVALEQLTVRGRNGQRPT